MYDVTGKIHSYPLRHKWKDCRRWYRNLWEFIHRFMCFVDKTWCIPIKATGNSRSGIPGNRGPPKFPVGIPWNFWNSGGNYGEFIGVLSFFPIFIADYGILVFNLTHCIMCTTHDRLTAFWAKPWMTYVFDPTFCVYRVPVYFQILISKNHWTASEIRKLRSLHECERWDNSNRS